MRYTGLALALLTVADEPNAAERADQPFEIVEATIDDVHHAIRAKEITTVGLVERYLARIAAYNGTWVREPTHQNCQSESQPLSATAVLPLPAPLAMPVLLTPRQASAFAWSL